MSICNAMNELTEISWVLEMSYLHVMHLEFFIISNTALIKVLYEYPILTYNAQFFLLYNVETSSCLWIIVHNNVGRYRDRNIH